MSYSKYGINKKLHPNNNTNFVTGYSSVNMPSCGYSEVSLDCNQTEGTLLNVDGIYTKRYNTSTGHLASTTGNITGIYDMSGGNWEAVLSFMKTSSGLLASGRSATYPSGFKGEYTCVTCDNPQETITGNPSGVELPASKYYDVYDFWSDDMNYFRRILGDATGEMGPFYLNKSQIISSWNQGLGMFSSQWAPFLGRGGQVYNGSEAGLSNFFRIYGNATGYRIVLAF